MSSSRPQPPPPPPSSLPVPTKVRRKLVGHKGPIYCVRFNAKGTYCMTGGQDKSIKLWNPFRSAPDKLDSALLVQTFTGPHGYEVRDIAITPDNTRFASVGGDRACFIWDVETSRVTRKYTGTHTQAHTQMLNSVCFGGAVGDLGGCVCTASNDKTVKIWDLRSNNRDPIQTLSDFRDSVTRVCVCVGDEAGGGRKDNVIMATSVDGCLRTYDFRKGCVNVDDCHEALSSLCVSYDGKCVLMNGLDGVVRLLERETGEMLNHYRGHVHKHYPVESCFNNTDAYILCGSEDGMLHVYDLVEGTTVAKLEGHKRVLGSLAYHPKESVCVTVGYDGVGLVWSGKGDD